MGQSISRSKGQYPPYAPPAGYYAPPYMPAYGQYGMPQPVQPFNPHAVVPYPYMPQAQTSVRRKKKRRNGTVSGSHSTRRRHAGPSHERGTAGSARFAESLNPSSRAVRRAQTPFSRPADLHEEDDEDSEEADLDRDEPVLPEGSSRHLHRAHYISEPHVNTAVPPPPVMKPLSPHAPNPLPLPPRDIFESEEYKAVMRGPIGTSAVLATMYPPKEIRESQHQRSKSGLFGKRSSKRGLFRSLTGTHKKKDEDPDIAMGNGIRLLPIPVGARDYHKLTTPSVSASSAEHPTFPHPPPGVAAMTSNQQPVPFLMAGADPNAAPPAPAQPMPVPTPAPSPSAIPSDSTEPLYFSQTHPDYGGFLPHSHHRIVHEGQQYKSATHLHEALKYPNHPHIAEAIRACTTLSDIFHIATSNADRARPDWAFKFVEVMESVMMEKFAQHPNLRALLLLTGNRPLVYSEERDSFWGDGVGLDGEGSRKPLAPGQGEGMNELGQMLMRVRDKLRNESPDPYRQQ
ncbi:DUF1768-domain-containing protein [Dendrothele bispora CBS 962.96]|uniref:DUF1768-domain-containing protein n=1 Tax=Dendrothele bispora (strain CBS 962.96) TaxID=1314807 RepID=A0A4S8MKI9_DENBC|nr:DUF1768-domain-containing protein [Dendrothele bispora CBS 962.96]